VRFVLCDDDEMFRSLVESIIVRHGHEIVGIADVTSLAFELVEQAQPDVLVIDLSLGYNTDFDVVEAAADVGATVIVFSFFADEAVLARYAEHPTVVAKPDFAALEDAIAALPAQRPPSEPTAAPLVDRRHHPARAAVGPGPTGLGDAQAFYEALNNAIAGDTLVLVELEEDGAAVEGCESVAAALGGIIRTTDRILAATSSVRIFLAGAEDDGGESLIHRMAAVALPATARVRSIVLGDDESPTDAFARLKHAPEHAH
jgi:CheY-like chemotaxis protein